MLLTTEKLKSSIRNRYQGKNNTCISTPPNPAPFAVFTILVNDNSSPSPTLTVFPFFTPYNQCITKTYRLLLQIISRVWPLLTTWTTKILIQATPSFCLEYNIYSNLTGLLSGFYSNITSLVTLYKTVTTLHPGYTLSPLPALISSIA